MLGLATRDAPITYARSVVTLTFLSIANEKIVPHMLHVSH